MSLNLGDNIKCRPGDRMIIPENQYAIKTLDHVALPVRDPLLGAQFVAAVLGGKIHRAVGYTPEEEARGRVKHIFMRVGETLVQVGYPHDGKTFPDPGNSSGWPHWAFEVSADDMKRNWERLQSLGIPINGPIRHPGSVSIYFQDPFGNKLELATYDGQAATWASGRVGGRTNNDWPSLAHAWRPKPEEAFAPSDFQAHMATGPRTAENVHGLRRIDHVALPVHDPDLSAQFVMAILGGRILMTSGYAPGEDQTGRVKHIFMHVGRTLVQVGYPHDGKTFPDPRNTSGWPHWAFEVTAEGMDRSMERLSENHIPFNGPVRHGPQSVSLYFQDPNGNKLEFTVKEPYSDERIFGLTGGRTNADWPSLAHEWRPKDHSAEREVV